MSRLWLIAILFLSASAPHGWAQVRQEPLDRVLRSDPPPARQSADDHTQGVTQRRSDEQVRTRAHDSRVEPAEPPWEYASPEDADILEGWDARFPAGAAKPPVAPGSPEPSALAQAWQLYRRGSFDAAAKAFTAPAASGNRQETLNARLGLAYSLIQQGRRDQAIAHLEYLVDEGYRPSETRLALIHALMQSGRWPEARAQIAQLPPDQRAAWEKRLLEARLLKEHRSLPRDAGLQALSAFVDSHKKALADCVRPDVFHDIAKRLAESGASQQATELRRRLLECPLPPELRQGILAELMNSLADEEALSLLEKERPGLRQAAPKAAAELDALELQILKRRLAAQPADSDAKARLAEEILKLAPADPDALSALAWHRFKRGEYSEAEKLFARLAQADPGNKDYALGLGYARLNSGSPDAALEGLDRGRVSEDAETRQLRQLVYRKQAADAYDSGQWDAAARHLEKLLALDPADAEAKELLAWTRYRQGRRDDARALMEESFAAKPSPSLAGGLLGVYTAAGDEDRARGMAERLADDPDPAIRAAVGPFFFDRGAPVTAAQLDRSPSSTRPPSATSGPRPSPPNISPATAAPPIPRPAGITGSWTGPRKSRTWKTACSWSSRKWGSPWRGGCTRTSASAPPLSTGPSTPRPPSTSGSARRMGTWASTAATSRIRSFPTSARKTPTATTSGDGSPATASRPARPGRSATGGG